jgi:hypothetical protein
MRVLLVLHPIFQIFGIAKKYPQRDNLRRQKEAEEYNLLDHE